jgi:hypothetical protein
MTLCTKPNNTTNLIVITLQILIVPKVMTLQILIVQNLMTIQILI